MKSVTATVSTGEFEEVPFNQIDVGKPFGIGDRFTGEFTGSFRREEPDDEEGDAIWLERLVSEYTVSVDARGKLARERTASER